MKYNFTVLYEEDKAEGNVSAYIPALKLDAIGDTFEEARENAADVAAAELERILKSGSTVPNDEAVMDIVQGCQVLFEEDIELGNVIAYLPALRLGVVGKSYEQAREHAETLLFTETEHMLKNGNLVMRNRALFDTLSVEVQEGSNLYL